MPAQFDVCEPDFDTASIQLIDENAYVGDVSLSAAGLPAGAIESFSVNPVTVPGTSTVSVDVSGATPGSYTITIAGTDGTLTREALAQLTVTDQPPGQSVAVSPPDGALGVSRVPTMEWSAASQASEYTLEISTDPGFGATVYSATTSTTTHIVADSLDPTTLYYWRVRAANPCGTGPYSPAAGFTTLAVPDILLVDDDDNGPDVRSSYTSALLALGRDFDVWDTNNTDVEPSTAALGPYKAVLWFTGDAFGGAAGPGPGGEQALAGWLDGTGCLLVSSQDYYYDRGRTDFMSTYLGVGFATSDINQTSADGRGSVFTGVGPYSFTFPYSNYTDTVLPDATAENAFQGSISITGVNKDAGIYRTAFLGFGLEALPNATAKEEAISAFLTWCDALFFLDSDADGVANENDCAPADPNVWSAPSAVFGLTVSEEAIDNLNWSAPTVLGAPAVTYDTLRSSDAVGFMSASCIESDETDTQATDAATPAQGEVYYYLVRVENDCGGNLGNGGSRNAISCP
jgi:hypothetical protein